MRHILRCVARATRRSHVVRHRASPRTITAKPRRTLIRGRVRAMKSVRLLVGFLVACSHPATSPSQPHPSPQPAPRGPVTLSIVGTNDLHGALERLPVFAGFVANLRAARAADGGGVVLVDGGDMFQGTLESNLAEGTDVVRAYNQIGYAAAAVGNHEFDYGPEGKRTVAASADDDPRGALKARMRE